MSESKPESQMLKTSTSDLKLDLKGNLKSSVNGNNSINTNTNKTSNTTSSTASNTASNISPTTNASSDTSENKKDTVVNPQNQVSISEITDELTNKLNEALMEINGSDKEFSRLFGNIEKRIVMLDKKV